jgi:hypothetical protein
MIGKTRQKSPRYSSQYGPVNKVVLFTNARDEKNIKEWAAHHLLLGFHRIVIFDHMSKIPISYVLKGFDKRVTVIRCVWNNPVKLRLMQTAINLSRSMRADWMLYLDADEFLVLPRYKNVVSFLSLYVNYDSVSVNWLMFGTNNIIKDPDGLIIDNFTKSCSTLDRHVKSFVRPMEAINAHNPHFFNIYDTSRRIGTDNRIVQVASPFHPFPIHFSKAPAYIAHYVHQSEETYTNRKVLLPTDDTGSMRGDIRAQVHSLYNDIDNVQVKRLYSENVNNFLISKTNSGKKLPEPTENVYKPLENTTLNDIDVYINTKEEEKEEEHFVIEIGQELKEVEDNELKEDKYSSSSNDDDFITNYEEDVFIENIITTTEDMKTDDMTTDDIIDIIVDNTEVE